jgi:Leucine-rich repeat (LRR) protein
MDEPMPIRLLPLLHCVFTIFLVVVLPGCAVQRAQQQRLAVDWITSQGGRVTYDHQAKNLKEVDVWYTAGSEEDEEQWKSRLPEDTWLAKTLGRDYAYRVDDAEFYQCKLTGDVARLANARGLRSLSFGECELSEELLNAIGKCRDLEQLTISDCRLANEESLAQLASLPKLVDLFVTRVSLDGNGLAHIGKCPNLKHLELTYCQFDAPKLEHLRNLTKLTYCGLGFTSVGDKQLHVVRGWPKLKRLELGTEVTDAGLAEVAQLKQIETLVFMKSQITDAGVEQLLALPKLREVQISGCQLSDEMLARLFKLHPDMKGGYVR